MKNKIFYIYLAAFLFIFSSCGQDYLDRQNLYEQLDVNYYSSPEQIESALTAIYSCLENDGFNEPLFLSNLMSDDGFGGGGPDDASGFQACDAFTNIREDNYLGTWSQQYKGIYRANMLISRFNQAKYDSITQQARMNQDLGEAYFLRGMFYLNLAELFGNVPLITETVPVNYPKASADELFGQIGSDLKKAIELMPSVKINIPVNGHTTRWAAEALMARAFLFYTEYYNKTEITLPKAGVITKNDVIGWIDDCVTNSGHDLIPDYRNLWPYSYVDASNYPYNAILVNGNTAHWAGDGNKESVFAVKYSMYGGWGGDNPVRYSNQVDLYMSCRGVPQEGVVPFGFGWGACPCNQQLFENWENNDLRKRATICDITDTIEGEITKSVKGVPNYTWGFWNMQQETGLWQKKHMTVMAKPKVFLGTVLTGKNNGYQLTDVDELVLIRFADVLLMGAELGSSKAQEYYDKVRTRAGLSTRTVSLENIKEERRCEFAFEGLRYFDLLRWHDAEAAFDKVKNVPVQDATVPGVYNSSFRPETGGFLPIPESQIRLSNGVLLQNPGW